MRFFSLSQKILAFSAVAALLLTIFISAIEIHNALTSSHHKVARELERFDNDFRKFLANKMWRMEYDSLVEFTASTAHNPWFNNITIRDGASNIIASSGKGESNDKISRTLELTYLHNDKHVNIGSVRLEGHVLTIPEVLKNRLPTTLLINGSLTIFIFVCAYFFVHRTVLSRLQDLTKLFPEEAANDDSQETTRRDEIDLVTQQLHLHVSQLGEELKRRRTAEAELERQNLQLKTEITERLQIEHELRNSREWHVSILKTAMDGFLLVDLKGRILEVNPAYCRMSGYSSQELLTMNVADLDASIQNSDINILIEKITQLGGDRFETTTRCKNGALINVEISAQYNPVNEGRIIVFIQDITERKKMEDINVFLAQSSFGGASPISFNSLAKYLAEYLAMDFVCIDRLDPDALTAHTVAVWCDGNFEDNISYGLIDTPCGQLVNQDFCCYPTNVCQFFPKDKVLLDLNAESYVGVALLGHTGKPIGLIAVIGRKPLQNRKLAESALKLIAIRASGEMERLLADEEKKKLQSQLLHALKIESIGTLAGGIAHDFNNILGAILGYAEMAREDSAPGSNALDKLDRVIEAGNRAAGLVKQILAFSRQAVSEPVLLNPKHIVLEAIKLLRPSLPTTITITQQFVNPINFIIADPTQIHQIVMNLCTNAFHAMEKTGGTLNISLENRELSTQDTQQYPNANPGNYVILSISDTGPGIPPEIRDRIFDPYFTTKEVGKGTGMGLAIIHGIATSLGGFITCESNPGQRTVFRTFLPAASSDVVVYPSISTDFIPTGKEHVLFVDDEEMLAELGKTMLERLGYHVTLCTDSIAALSLVHEYPNKFDILVTDQTMPKMTGFDLARNILQIRPNLPIILCTGYSNLVDEEVAKQSGIRGFIMKPLTKKGLADLLAKVKNESNSQKQIT